MKFARLGLGFPRSVLLGLAFFLGLMILFPNVSAADSLDEDLPVSLSILPNQPTIADHVVLTVDGTWQNGCVPQFTEVTIYPADHVVRVDALSNSDDGPCSQAVTPYSFSVDLLFDVAGTYQLFYYVQDGPNGKPVSAASMTLDVAGGLRISPFIATVDDTVNIVVSDVATSTCVPAFESSSVEEQTVFIDLVSGQDSGPCGTVASPWSHSVTLTDLPPGIYTVQVRMSQIEDGLRISSRISHQLPLVVLTELHQLYLPMILLD
jgi:hypothetical protein